MLVRLRKRLLQLIYLGFSNLLNKKYKNFPFGKNPIADQSTYKKLATETKNKTYPQINSFEIESNYAIDKKWLDELAIHTQITVKESELCYQHGNVLYAALSRYMNNHPPKNEYSQLIIYEIGTARGFSALCIAKALSDHNRAGIILTIDAIPHNTRFYWNIIDDHDGPKSRAELLEPWQDLVKRHIIFYEGNVRMELPKFQMGRIHFAFIDGPHEYEDVMFQFQQIKNQQEPGDVIIYDDYAPDQFPGVVKAVDEICQRYHYQPTILKASSFRGYAVTTKI